MTVLCYVMTGLHKNHSDPPVFAISASSAYLNRDFDVEINVSYCYFWPFFIQFSGREKRVRSGSRASNSGHPKRNRATCQSTAHKAIGSDETYLFM